MMRIYKGWYNQQTSFSNKVEEMLKKATWSDGNRIGRSDNTILMINCWASYLVDIQSNHTSPNPEIAFNLILEIISAYSTCFEFMFTDLKWLVSWMRNLLPIRDVRDYCRKVGRPHAVMALVRPVHFLLLGRKEVSHFQDIHGFWMFVAKATFDRADLERQAFRDYLANEQAVAESPVGDPYIQAMSWYIGRWMRGWDECEILSHCHLSSGSTSDETRDLAEKVRYLHLSPAAARMIIELSWIAPETEKLDLFLNMEVSDTTDDSELKFVPKTALSKRTICMESASQNFIKNGLDWTIRHCSTFPVEHIDFEHQEKSREMALRGSADGTIATVDMSAASDMISNDQVKAAFSRCGRLCWWLQALRTPVTVYYVDKDRTISKPVYLKKFASMGAPETFTVESLMFLAACEVACDIAGVPSNRRRHELRVYGDDCIIPTEAYDPFARICSALGWRLNADKSFKSGYFREACGMFAYRGTDVTPVSWSRNSISFLSVSMVAPPKWGVPYEVLNQAVMLANRCLIAGMYYTRYILVRTLLAAGGKVVSILPTRETIVSLEQSLSEKEKRLALTGPLLLWSLARSDHKPYQMVGQDMYLGSHLEKRVKNRVGSKAHPFLTIEDGLAFKMSKRRAIFEREWTEEERLEIWLYQSEFSRRERVSPLAPTLEEPIRVGRGLEMSRSETYKGYVFLSL